MMLDELPSPRLAWFASNVPPVMVVGPEYVLPAPFRTSGELPFVVSPPGPEMVPWNVAPDAPVTLIAPPPAPSVIGFPLLKLPVVTSSPPLARTSGPEPRFALPALSDPFRTVVGPLYSFAPLS